MLYWLDYFSIYSALIPIITGFVFYKQLIQENRVFLFYLCFSLFVDFVNVMLFNRKLNNIWVMNVFMVFEFFMFSYLSTKFSVSDRISKWIFAGTGVFYLFWIWNMLIKNSILEFSNLLNFVEYFSLIVFSGFALIKISEQVQENILLNSRFWIMSGSTIYFSGSIFVFCIADQLVHVKESVMINIWSIHSVLTIFSCILFAIGFACHSRKPIQY